MESRLLSANIKSGPTASVQSEINTIIENALNGIHAVSPPPPLETVSAAKDEELKRRLQQLSNPIHSIPIPSILPPIVTNNVNNLNNLNTQQLEQETPKQQEIQLPPATLEIHETASHHKHRGNKITWSNCHSFSADCHICNETVNDYEAYCNHLKIKHYEDDDDLEWLTCDVCGKMNAHKSNFISHLASHTGRKPFKCRVMLNSGEYCATEASTRQNLQTHILKVHKLAVKHKLQQNKSKSKSHASDPHKKKKKKKRKKKRNYDELDINMDDLDIMDPIYGYSYKPRRSKRVRPNRKLSVEAQKDSPYCHPLEILIAAATYVEMNNISIENNVSMTSQQMKEAARNWEKILDAQTIQKLKNAADLIDDIHNTKQIH